MSVCRFCGSKGTRRDHLTNWNDISAEWIGYLPIKISTSDGLPQCTCNVCKNQLQNVGKFFTQILDIDAKFREKTMFFVNVKQELEDSGGREMDDFIAPAAPKPPTAINSIIQKLQNTNTTIARVAKSAAPAIIKPENSERQKSPVDEMIEASCDYSESGGSEDSDNTDNSDSDSDYVQSEPKRSQKECNIAPSRAPVATKTATKPNKQQVYPVFDIPSLSYLCVRCRSRFTSQELLEAHMRPGSDCHNQSLTCDECNRGFKSRKQLNRHLDNAHREHPVFKCERCLRNYSSLDILKKHILTCVGDYEDQSGIIFKCKECDLQYDSKQELLNHIANHPKTLLCDECGKSCKSKKAYHQHRREHLKLKPYVCEFCAKPFRSRTLLQSHQHVHTGVKSFGCGMCEKSFAKKSSLISHMRLHTGERPYPCTDCEERFTTLEKLKSHRKRHIEGNLY